MSAAVILAKGTNTVEGDQELTIKIGNIATVEATAQQILQLGVKAAKVTTIEIDTTSYFQAIEEQEELAERYSAGLYCPHLINILDAIKSHGGGLATFSWSASQDTSTYFTRAHAFWTALYAHAGSLQKLHLGFFCHEVHAVPSLPPGTRLENLRDLRLDTSSAHGDDGTAIDTLLHACPNLEILHFEWPHCDLESCQIKNISWDWNYPKLTHLCTYGWNFAPTLYTDFLLRHPTVTSIDERVDGPWNPSTDELVQARLPTAALPNLQILKTDSPQTHGLCDYFNTAANRPIHTLVLHVSFRGIYQKLLDLAVLPLVQQNLHTLEFLGDIQHWRPCREDQSESSSDSDEPPSERTLRHAEEERQRIESERTSLPNILKATLPHFVNLETLSIEMESSNGTWDSRIKDYVYLDPMHRHDLYAVLGLLPKRREGRLQVLRMRDSRALSDPGSGQIREWLSEMSAEMGDGEAAAGSLRVLEWCGEKGCVIEMR